MASQAAPRTPSWTERLATVSAAYTSRPIPNYLTGGALLSLFPSSFKNASLRPRPWAIILFAPPMFLSGVMTSQGAKLDGAGTMGAWSVIYLLVERRGLGRMAAGGWMGRSVWGLMGVNGVMGISAWVTGEREDTEGWVGDV